MLNRFLTVLTFATLPLACTSSSDDSSPSTEAGVDVASSSSQEEAGADDSPTGVPGGPNGCYYFEGHYCDCEIDEATCEESDGTWAEECECDEQDAVKPMASVEAGSGKLASGCYMPDEHSCDCDLDADECEDVEGTWSDQCTSCGASTSEGGAPSGGGAGDAGKSAAGPGCYSPTTHTCDCDTTPAQCEDDGNIWSEECPCGGESAMDGGTPSLTEGGALLACYVPANHVCDCSFDEEQCADENGIWTDECTSCDASIEGGTRSEHTGMDASAGAFGCYDPTGHGCDCDASEGDCTAAGGIWTDQCAACGTGTGVDAGHAEMAEAGDPEAGDSGMRDSGGTAE